MTQHNNNAPAHGILRCIIAGTIFWLLILIPACLNGQTVRGIVQQIDPIFYIESPSGISEDTTREYQVIGDTLFVVESWNDARIQNNLFLGDGRDWIEWIDRPAGRRRLIYRLTLIGEQKPCMIEVTTTTTHLEEVWGEKN